MDEAIGDEPIPFAIHGTQLPRRVETERVQRARDGHERLDVLAGGNHADAVPWSLYRPAFASASSISSRCSAR